MDRKEILKRLKLGETIILSRTRNQYGDKIPTSWLRFDDGVWLEGEITCWSSQDHGLGTCRCNSHPSIETIPVERERVLELIDRYIREGEEKERKRKEEIEWLERETYGGG